MQKLVVAGREIPIGYGVRAGVGRRSDCFVCFPDSNRNLPSSCSLKAHSQVDGYSAPFATNRSLNSDTLQSVQFGELGYR